MLRSLVGSEMCIRDSVCPYPEPNPQPEKVGTLEEFPELTEQLEAGSTSPLMRVVELWLRAERRDNVAERAESQVKELVEDGFEKADAKVVKKYADSSRLFKSSGKDQYNYW
eukprot:TRINITY_DN2106_c0_g1_i2.p1 TRINITY_DN2106_c0_g1~~TRINITY_DN2106_c0_g1_i2.p1  ORF type:complete len:112 (-),score=40.58 TRINITY_DN2106_c0_g1_i2:347-682(-)